MDITTESNNSLVEDAPSDPENAKEREMAGRWQLILVNFKELIVFKSL